MKKIAALLIVPALGCTTTPKPNDLDWSSKNEAEQRRLLDEIAKRCELPEDFFNLQGEHLTIRPKPTEKYQRVDCALEALQPVRGGPRVGFIGNEALPDDPK